MYWINIVGGSLASSLGLMISFCILKNKNYRNIRNIIFLFFSTLSVTLTNHYLPGIQKMLINIMVSIILSSYLICDKNIKEGIIYTFSFFIFSTLEEIILAIFLSLLLKIGITLNLNNYMLLFSILNSIFIIYIIRINKIKKLIYKLLDYNKFIYFMLFFIFTLLVFIIYKNYYVVDNQKNIIFNIILYLFIIYTGIILFRNTLSKQKIKIQYNQMLDYVTEYEDIINEQGKKNHEYKNQLMILDGFLEEKKYKQVKEYLNTIIGDQTFGQNYKIKQLSNFPNGGIKGLMYYKINKMEENKIKYFLYVTEDVKKNFENIDLNLYKDITKIFGVIIDNAIDACLEAKKKEIVIDLKTEDNFIVINIDNTYENKDIKKVGKKGYSTKGKGHGFGLSLVKDIIRKNNRLELNSEFNDNYYTQTLFIKLKKN